MKLPKDFVARFTSRKFLLTVFAVVAALGTALQDSVVSQTEIWAILTPILAFIGVEGAGDVAGRYRK